MRTGARRSNRLHSAPSEQDDFADFFVSTGRRLKSELWIIILLTTGGLLIVQAFLLDVPSELVPFWPYFLAGIIVPMILRWLSGAQSPVRRGSTAFFIASVYIDLACLMSIRVMSIRAGLDLLPILIPLTMLLAMVVAQIRFVVLAPAMLVGFAGVAAAELLLVPVTSNGLFNLVASSAILLAPLAACFELERATRAAWSRVRRLDEMSSTDPLTSLPNRRSFEETVDGLLADTADRPVSLAIIDLDEFKRLNDTLGHAAGDHALQAIGSYLLSHVEAAHEFTARLSGEEFAVVWHGTDRSSARRRAEELRCGIERLGLASGTGGDLTASAGFAELGDVDGAPARARLALVQAADKSLYTAKAAGRDRLAEHDGLVSAADWPNASTAEPMQSNPSLLDTGYGLRRTRLGLTFDDNDEVRFRAVFDATGGALRRLISGAIILVSLGIFVSMDRLQTPIDAQLPGKLFLGLGIIPGAALGLIGTVGPWRRWSAEIYVASVALVAGVQMVQRIIQLPKGYDVVPFIMPLSVILSLTVVQIRIRLLVPAAAVLCGSMVTAELVVFPITTERVYMAIAAVVMMAVGVRFSYRIETARRIDWAHAERLYTLSRTDTLTGLPNRRRFQEDLTATLIERGATSGLLFLDVDRLKRYNDEFGHLAGDVCLRQISDALERRRHPHDTVAGIGGEEFVAILRDSSPDVLRQRADTLVRAIAELRIPGPRDGVVTASGGFTLVRDDDDEQSVTARADGALFQAKELGRNRMVAVPEPT